MIIELSRRHMHTHCHSIDRSHRDSGSEVEGITVNEGIFATEMQKKIS